MKTILLALLFGLSTLTIASGGHDGKKKMHKQMRKHKKNWKGKKEKLSKMKEKLGLSDDQVSKIKSIRESSKDRMKTLRGHKKSAKKQFKEAMKGSTKSPAELRSLFNIVQNKKSEIANARFEKKLAVRAILTPEQLAKRKNFGSDDDDSNDED